MSFANSHPKAYVVNSLTGRIVMKITKDTVVSMRYKLTDNDGNTLDSSEGRDPLVYLQGHQNIIPGLESQMEGKVVGDKFQCHDRTGARLW